MKAIIEGKRYDTRTATEIANYWNGCSPCDFNHISESPDKSAKNTYFLTGKGGPLTQCSEACEGGRCQGRGSRIIPLTAEEARQWLEEMKKTDVLEA